MKTRRWTTGMAFLALTLVMAIGSYVVMERWEASRPPHGDVDWLADEFGLAGKDLEKAGELARRHHESTAPLVQRIREAEAEVHRLTGALGTVPATEMSEAVHRLDALRADLQVAILEHVREISPMFGESARRRYVAEMERRVLGVSGPVSGVTP